MDAHVEYVPQSMSREFCHHALYVDLRVSRESIDQIVLEETEIYLER
jgi:hypothetical protein